MRETNRDWLPPYCDPRVFLPTVQETIVLFSQPPFLFRDFVGRALTFLASDRMRSLGFAIDVSRALPCKWKCADESLFGVDLSLYAYTGKYPFDKGSIGSGFNQASLAAATSHADCSIDFGGAHVGYTPGPGGGRFGYIQRPLHGEEASTDCGYLMGVIRPFKQAYDDACASILLSQPEGSEVLISIPNELLQPGWTSHPIKLLVDVERLTAGTVPYAMSKGFTHKIAGRSLFHVHPDFLAGLAPAAVARFRSPAPASIGSELTAEYFHIYDSTAETTQGGLPAQRLLPYMKFILAAKLAPYPLKAAVTQSNIEYNRLTDSIRKEAFRQHAFASFTGVFIDMHDPEENCYVNLFQPIGLALKPAGQLREIELRSTEVHELLHSVEPANPLIPLEGILPSKRAHRAVEQFTFRPGHFAHGP